MYLNLISRPAFTRCNAQAYLLVFPLQRTSMFAGKKEKKEATGMQTQEEKGKQNCQSLSVCLQPGKRLATNKLLIAAAYNYIIPYHAIPDQTINQQPNPLFPS